MLFFLLSLIIQITWASTTVYPSYYNATRFGTIWLDLPLNPWFVNASRNPLYQNELPFLGFDFGPNYSETQTVPTTNSSDLWTLHFNYSVILANISDNNPYVSNLAYSLRFPEQSLPISNSTDWQLCAHVSRTPFPNSVARTNAPNTGSCVPYLGEDCYNAFLERFRTAQRTAYGCATIPTFSEIPECRSRFGTYDNDFNSQPIMNFTDPEVEFNTTSLTFVNSFTGQEVTDPPFHGLERDQPFLWHSTDLGQQRLDNSLVTEQSAQVWFTAFSMVPSDEIVDIASQTGEDHSVLQNNVRLTCGRVSAEADGDRLPSDASGSSCNHSFLALAIGLAMASSILF